MERTTAPDGSIMTLTDEESAARYCHLGWFEKVLAAKIEAMPPKRKFTIQWDNGFEITARTVMASTEQEALDICKRIASERAAAEFVTKAWEYDDITDSDVEPVS